MPSHISVLSEETLRFLDPKPGGRFIDATLGAGGHARAILEKTAPGGIVLGIDQDESAISRAQQALSEFGPRLTLVKGNFREIESIAREYGFIGADGVLADIGVSSMMLDDPARGFSFMHEGPLDMRMDRSRDLDASIVLNTYGEREIADILFQFGEERRSRPIARSILHSRPLKTTTDLVRAVEKVMGAPRFGQIHPATRTFQALRIFVNDELGSLENFIDGAMGVARPGGRVVVISFHSLEDRIVKNKFRAAAVSGKVLTKKVVVAADEERRRNPRSRSAKLRAWEKY